MASDVPPHHQEYGVTEMKLSAMMMDLHMRNDDWELVVFWYGCGRRDSTPNRWPLGQLVMKSMMCCLNLKRLRVGLRKALRRIIVNVLAEAGNEASVRIKRGKGSSSSNPSSTSLSIKIRSGTGIQHRDENSPEASSRGSSERVSFAAERGASAAVLPRTSSTASGSASAAVPPRNIVYDIGLCKCCWSE